MTQSINMDEWQRIRLDRAKRYGLHCARVEFSDDSAMLLIDGVTGQYTVEINQNADLWPPTCTCEDNMWRPDLFCKHIVYALKLMGIEDEFLIDCTWEPDQQDIYEYLSNAPDCVGCSLVANSTETKPGDSRERVPLSSLVGTR